MKLSAQFKQNFNKFFNKQKLSTTIISFLLFE